MSAHRTPDEELFAALYPALRSFAAVVGDWQAEPDDLVQEALARTLARRRLSDLEAPAAYLRQTIFNLAVSSQRRQKRWRAFRDRQPASDAVAVQPMPSDLGELWRLSAIDRAVIFLADVEGLPHQETADLLGLTSQAVRNRVVRARRQLSEALSTEEAER